MKFKKNKAESIFDLKDNELGISIHKYIGCGDELFLNCKAFGIQNEDLRTENFDDALELAKIKIINKAISLKNEAEKFFDDKSKNEFVNY